MNRKLRSNIIYVLKCVNVPEPKRGSAERAAESPSEPTEAAADDEWRPVAQRGSMKTYSPENDVDPSKEITGWTGRLDAGGWEWELTDAKGVLQRGVEDSKEEAQDACDEAFGEEFPKNS